MARRSSMAGTRRRPARAGVRGRRPCPGRCARCQTRSSRSGRYRRTGAGPPRSPTLRKNISRDGQFDAVRHPDVADHAAGTDRPEGLEHRLGGADALEDRVGTDPVGELHDRPRRRRRRARSRCRWHRTRRRAVCRGSWRLIAMTRSAPSCDAASTPHSPTAPSPTTATVMPGRTPAETAACQPVLITSDSASRLRDQVVRRQFGVAHQGAVGQRDPDELGLAAVVAAAVAQADWNPARQCGQVLSERQEAADDELPGRDRGDVGADLLDDAAVLVADRRAARAILSIPRYGHRSEPQTQVATVRTIASVGSTIGGIGSLFDAYVTGGVQDGSAHAGAFRDGDGGCLVVPGVSVSGVLRRSAASDRGSARSGSASIRLPVQVRGYSASVSVVTPVGLRAVLVWARLFHMARWAMKWSGAAPCQCHSPGAV